MCAECAMPKYHLLKEGGENHVDYVFLATLKRFAVVYFGYRDTLGSHSDKPAVAIGELLGPKPKSTGCRLWKAGEREDPPQPMLEPLGCFS